MTTEGKAMRPLLIGLLATSLLMTEQSAKIEQKKVPNKIWAGMSVNRPIFLEVDKDTDLVIHFALVNDTDSAFAPELSASKLLVNGKELKDWPFIVENGLRDERTNALPAGDNLLFTYSLREKFQATGTYKLIWKGKAFESSEVVFRILPKAKS